MADRTWTVSNAISCSRVVLLIPLAYCLFSDFDHNRTWAAAILIVGALTDFLDGFLARRLHEVSELGKIIDPLADKVSVAVVAIFLVILGDLSLWYLGVVLARDMMILAGGLYIRKEKHIIAQSNWPGKVAVNIVALYLLASVLQWDSVFKDPVLWASIGMMALSLAMYARRLFIGRTVGREA